MNKTLFVLFVLTAGAFLQSCGTDDTPDVSPARTVDRSLLYDKDWNYNGSTWHRFNSDGSYFKDGTWKWLGDNNSDSMEVDDGIIGKFTLHFDYIEAKEMKCGSGQGERTTYTSP